MPPLIKTKYLPKFSWKKRLLQNAGFKGIEKRHLSTADVISHLLVNVRIMADKEILEYTKT